MSRVKGEILRIEDDLDENWVVDFVEDGLKEMEGYLANYLAFARFCIEKAREEGDIEDLQEWGELEAVELQHAA